MRTQNKSRSLLVEYNLHICKRERDRPVTNAWFLFFIYFFLKKKISKHKEYEFAEKVGRNHRKASHIP